MPEADDPDAFLREHGGLESLARRLGQEDPQGWRWVPRDNDNGSAEPASPGTLFLAFVVGSLLAAVLLVWLWG